MEMTPRDHETEVQMTAALEQWEVRLKAHIARFLHSHEDGADTRKRCFNS
jgi:hypothetical protein